MAKYFSASVIKRNYEVIADDFILLRTWYSFNLIFKYFTLKKLLLLNIFSYFISKKQLSKASKLLKINSNLIIVTLKIAFIQKITGFKIN